MRRHVAVQGLVVTQEILSGSKKGERTPGRERMRERNINPRFQERRRCNQKNTYKVHDFSMFLSLFFIPFHLRIFFVHFTFPLSKSMYIAFLNGISGWKMK